MQIRLTPLIKGFITGALMIAVVVGFYYSNQPSDSPLQYVIYGLYGLGIIWTLVAYRQSVEFTGKFTDLFFRGFRCFIIVTLLMVIFTFVFNKMHPEFAAESTEAYRQELIKNPPKDMLPSEMDKAVTQYKNNYNTVLIYGSIFGYLIIGAGVTALISGLLTRRT
ncbi:MAG: DUF4199 domain-containing protein [Chitinophagaceae bacterium]|nr:DUF4199 domain-containing protein [Chitinophagaceae bacterium]